MAWIGKALHVRVENAFMFGTTPDPTIPKAYQEYADGFSEAEARRLPEHGPQDHAIDLDESQSPSFGPLYNLSRTELDILRHYIEKNLAKAFLRSSNSSAGASV